MERDSILAEAVYCLNTNFRLIWNGITNQPNRTKKNEADSRKNAMNLSFYDSK